MEKGDIVKAAMDSCENYMPYEPGARLDPDMEQAYKDGFCRGAEWALSHQWQKPDYSKIEEGREYLVRLPDGCVVAQWSRGDTYVDDAGILHWRNGNLWYLDGLVLAIMEIPEYERA